jgi:hypothetical protein
VPCLRITENFSSLRHVRARRAGNYICTHTHTHTRGAARLKRPGVAASKSIPLHTACVCVCALSKTKANARRRNETQVWKTKKSCFEASMKEDMTTRKCKTRIRAQHVKPTFFTFACFPHSLFIRRARPSEFQFWRDGFLFETILLNCTSAVWNYRFMFSLQSRYLSHTNLSIPVCWRWQSTGILLVESQNPAAWADLNRRKCM